ncbi:hypothetical protein Tco_0937052 [Tanacetum coccineum]|uniref:Uncharacterized protein n=1 Tax=Tanacetum coccineum TaxID=301880 RepID=A0ABQ5DFT0_9ASTR
MLSSAAANRSGVLCLTLLSLSWCDVLGMYVSEVGLGWLVNKLQARLSKWKVKTLSIEEAKITLLKSLLGASPIFIWSILSFPYVSLELDKEIEVATKIGSIYRSQLLFRRDFAYWSRADSSMDTPFLQLRTRLSSRPSKDRG